MIEVDEVPMLVQVVDVQTGRQINWGGPIAARLTARLTDIRKAIAAGAQAVADGLADMPAPSQWEVGEVSARFGITLTADAGVLLSRAGAGATFEVTVKFKRASPDATNAAMAG